MEILSDRIGILLKYGKVMGGLTKRFFFIDNRGVLYYTDKENVISDLLKNTSDSYHNDKIVSSLIKISKPINLLEITLSGVKTYLEDQYNLKGRSYFELSLKERDYRSILVFSWKEEDINSLRDYISSFSKDTIFTNENLQNFESEGSKTEFSIKETECDHLFPLANYKSNMDHNLNKLGGRFKNQTDWEKESIKVVNPTSELEEYEEAWVELDNGSNYSGPVKNGTPHGYGKEYRQDGSLYAGYFLNGKWHGSGTLTNEILDSYQGEFIDGCICGI